MGSPGEINMLMVVMMMMMMVTMMIMMMIRNLAIGNMVMVMVMVMIMMRNLSVQEERVNAMQAEEERQARWQAATNHT